MSNSVNNKRIAKNTVYLYFRMIIIMAVSLFTSRVILQTLGVEDFGIFNLVAGITSMLQFLNGTLADATQRYITFEIGKGDRGNVQKIFSQCFILHLFLGIIVVILAELIGLWFLNYKLIIPTDRLYAANWIFQFSIISIFILIISVPYNALIIAHERMKAFAMISIVEVLGRLVIAYSLILTNNDRLILYGFLMMSLQLILRFCYTIYCSQNFSETKIQYSWDRKLLKEMSSFASWTIIGNIAFISVTQGISILLGMFFLPVVNAARGIAVQVQNAVVTFVRNFQTAINPQITKSYASGGLSETHSLIFRSSRFSFYLVLLPLLPIFIEIDTILKLWLTEVPQYTTDFVRIILLISLINCIANPLAVANKASGRIKEYELYAASLKLLVLPVAYILLKMDYSPTIVFLVYLVFESLAFLSNVFITSRYVHFNISDYFQLVLKKLFLVTLVAICIPTACYLLMPLGVFRLISVTILSICSTLFAIYIGGLSIEERLFFKSKIQVLRQKIK